MICIRTLPEVPQTEGVDTADWIAKNVTPTLLTIVQQFAPPDENATVRHAWYAIDLLIKYYAKCHVRTIEMAYERALIFRATEITS